MLISAVGGQHAVIHRDLPRIGNVGYVLRSEGQPTLFHPGDASTPLRHGVDILAVPAYGPWAAMKETIDFVRAVGALEGFPIHDGLLSERGLALVFSRVNEMTGNRGSQSEYFAAVSTWPLSSDVVVVADRDRYPTPPRARQPGPPSRQLVRSGRADRGDQRQRGSDGRPPSVR